MSQKFTTVLDASLIGTLQTQITNVNVRVMQAEYPDLPYSTLLPVNTNYSAWQPSAQAIDLSVGFGEAQWVTGYSKDVPQVEIGAAPQTISFDMFAMGWKTNVQEVGQAAYAGINIPDAKARAARRKAEEFINTVSLFGDAIKGFNGLASLLGITTLTAATKAAGGTGWVKADGTVNATPQEIAADMVEMVMGPISATTSLRPIVADTVAIPSAAVRALAGTYTDLSFGGISYLEYVQRAVRSVPGGQNFTIVDLPELAAAGTNGRAIAYRRSLDVLELPMPMPFQFLNEYKDAPLGYHVPGIGIIGPVTVWNSRGIRYMDGLINAA